MRLLGVMGSLATVVVSRCLLRNGMRLPQSKSAHNNCSHFSPLLLFALLSCSLLSSSRLLCSSVLLSVCSSFFLLASAKRASPKSSSHETCTPIEKHVQHTTKILRLDFEGFGSRVLLVRLGQGSHFAKALAFGAVSIS